MKIAILDLGTNTFNIFIAELFPDKSYRKIYKSKIAVKLGEGGINNNLIAAVPFERGINALKKHKKTIEKFGVGRIIAFATSAIRSAENRELFIKTAKEKTGIEIQTISGDREAELIYYGVKSSVAMSDSPSLIMDIGGGSTEFIIATGQKILWKQSFLLGVSRILEKFHPSDPITGTEIAVIQNHLEENLSALCDTTKKHAATELIGSSGSFDSFAEMIAWKFYDISILKGKTEYEFNLMDFNAICETIIKSTLTQRLNMKGLSKMRADMIVISSIFIKYIFDRISLKRIRLSKGALKEGVLWELLNKGNL